MIYQKRGQWCFRDENGRQHKFKSEAEAKAAYGIKDEEKTTKLFFEETTNTDEQEIVFESESGSEEEI